MKKFTHAWLAFMAIKRLQYANIPDTYKADAQALVKWFNDYRDFVIKGSWYPDAVFKDMATSHILKYRPDEKSLDNRFKKLPKTIEMYQLGKSSPLYGKPFTIEDGNLADRCESLSHGIIDSFKMLRMEEKGNPVSPTGNHIAMRFFILSHYIADCHMPLHCDCRSFSSGDNVHGFIETQWDAQVKKSYKVDTANERFFYDPDGYPLKLKITPLMQQVEDDLENREYLHSWGTDNGNVWDYISSLSQYSYLMAYRMFPAQYDENNLTKAVYKTTEEWQHFEEYSRIIFSDAIDSIARVWLHVWIRYRKWATGRE